MVCPATSFGTMQCKSPAAATWSPRGGSRVTAHVALGLCSVNVFQIHIFKKETLVNLLDRPWMEQHKVSFFISRKRTI